MQYSTSAVGGKGKEALLAAGPKRGKHLPGKGYRETQMNDKPLITVIVPIYNIEEYLPRCVRSIMAQTYGNLEILLVDDGSTDGTGQLCDRLGQEDSRIRVLHKENGGSSSARNLALETARGKYVGFVDSDDYIDPDMYRSEERRVGKECRL